MGRRPACLSVSCHWPGGHRRRAPAVGRPAKVRPPRPRATPSTCRSARRSGLPGVEVIDSAVRTRSSRRPVGAGGPFDGLHGGAEARAIRDEAVLGGLTLTPDYTIANAPRPDILVVPGGNIVGTYKDAAVQQWIKKPRPTPRSTSAAPGLQRCLLPGASGSLDGLKATTAAPLIDGLKGVVPTCQPVYDRRVVDNARSSPPRGCPAGIDGALHLVEKIAGHDIAFLTALNMEYNWQPKGDYARGAALADRWLRAMLGRNGFDFAGKVEGWRAVHQEGDRTTWTKAWEFRSTAAPELLMADVDRKLGETWARKQPTAAPERESDRQVVTTTTNGGPTHRVAGLPRRRRQPAGAPPPTAPAGAAAPYGLVIRLDKVGARPPPHRPPTARARRGGGTGAERGSTCALHPTGAPDRPVDIPRKHSIAILSAKDQGRTDGPLLYSLGEHPLPHPPRSRHVRSLPFRLLRPGPRALVHLAPALRTAPRPPPNLPEAARQRVARLSPAPPGLQSNPEDVYWSNRYGPPGFEGLVTRVGTGQGDLIVGGSFMAYDGQPAGGVARWNGTTWQPVGSGVNTNIYTTRNPWHPDPVGPARRGRHVRLAGGQRAVNVATWNGSAWTRWAACR